MSNDDIQQIIDKAKAQRERLSADSLKAREAMDAKQQRRRDASARWNPFKGEFESMVADVNAAIAPGDIMISLSTALPPGRERAPNELGQYTLELDYLGGGRSRTSMTLIVTIDGHVVVTALNTKENPGKGFAANIVDTPIADFRTLVLRYVDLTVSA